jgi:hypothetical protein
MPQKNILNWQTSYIPFRSKKVRRFTCLDIICAKRINLKKGRICDNIICCGINLPYIATIHKGRLCHCPQGHLYRNTFSQFFFIMHVHVLLNEFMGKQLSYGFSNTCVLFSSRLRLLYLYGPAFVPSKGKGAQ